MPPTKAPEGSEERKGSDTTAFGREECEIFVKGSGRGADPSTDSC